MMRSANNPMQSLYPGIEHCAGEVMLTEHRVAWFMEQAKAHGEVIPYHAMRTVITNFAGRLIDAGFEDFAHNLADDAARSEFLQGYYKTALIRGQHAVAQTITSMSGVPPERLSADPDGEMMRHVRDLLTAYVHEERERYLGFADGIAPQTTGDDIRATVKSLGNSCDIDASMRCAGEMARHVVRASITGDHSLLTHLEELRDEITDLLKDLDLAAAAEDTTDDSARPEHEYGSDDGGSPVIQHGVDTRGPHLDEDQSMDDAAQVEDQPTSYDADEESDEEL